MAATTVNRLGLTPTMLNHAAYVTHDAAATVDFYTQVMGMELASTLMGDRIPSTGDAFPYFHLFFRMGDGSTMAFFESPGLPPAAKASHPAYDVFNHIAFQVDSVRELERWRDWVGAETGILHAHGWTDHCFMGAGDRPVRPPAALRALLEAAPPAAPDPSGDAGD